MPTLILDIDENGFSDLRIAALTHVKVDFHHAMTTAVKSAISEQLEKLVAAGVCPRYGFRQANQSRIVIFRKGYVN